MIILKLILWILSIFVTLMWVSKLLADFASAFLSSLATDEERIRDASYRIKLMIIMSILWAVLIIIS
jgi:hypothetical protein